MENLSKKNMENLLNFLVPFAQQLLQKYGEFYPFGAYVNSANEIVATGEYLENDQPEPNEVIESLFNIFKIEYKNKNILVAGMCTDNVVTNADGKKSDAIVVQLEDINGESILASIQYKKNNHEQYDYEDIEFSKSEPKFFV